MVKAYEVLGCGMAACCTALIILWR